MEVWDELRHCGYAHQLLSTPPTLTHNASPAAWLHEAHGRTHPVVCIPSSPTGLHGRGAHTSCRSTTQARLYFPTAATSKCCSPNNRMALRPRMFNLTSCDRKGRS